MSSQKVKTEQLNGEEMTITLNLCRKHHPSSYISFTETCKVDAEGAVNGLINILDYAGFTYEEIAEALCVNCKDIDEVITHLRLAKDKVNSNAKS